MFNFIWFFIFLITFCAMEFNAWFLHKYIMHGSLWNLHKDHHLPDKNKVFQKNDFFALFFAVPSFLLILFDHVYLKPVFGAIGYGILFYGVAYFFIHEVIIHRRVKIIDGKGFWYFRGLNIAHKLHHTVKTKEGASNFGMLVVPLHHFAKAMKKSHNA